MLTHTLQLFEPVEVLREREARTASTLREIDDHLRRLKAARNQREAALARIRAQLALVGPAVPDCHAR